MHALQGDSTGWRALTLRLVGRRDFAPASGCAAGAGSRGHDLFLRPLRPARRGDAGHFTRHGRVGSEHSAPALRASFGSTEATSGQSTPVSSDRRAQDLPSNRPTVSPRTIPSGRQKGAGVNKTTLDPLSSRKSEPTTENRNRAHKTPVEQGYLWVITFPHKSREGTVTTSINRLIKVGDEHLLRVGSAHRETLAASPCQTLCLVCPPPLAFAKPLRRMPPGGLAVSNFACSRCQTLVYPPTLALARPWRTMSPRFRPYRCMPDEN
jgi:hypothetical protein